jgi:invasion protein IalB
MKTLLIMAAALTASAAVAQTQPAPHRSAPDAGANAGLDMNETVCRSQSVVGSRLTRNRVCVTRQQWLEQQRMDRLYTERAQTNRIWPQ